MLFIFTDKISRIRKTFYLGLMLLILALVLHSILFDNVNNHIDLYLWIFPVFITGLCICFATLTYSYRERSVMGGRFAFILLIPPLMIVLVHLIFILSSREHYGEIYIIQNSWRILLVSIPVMAIVEFFVIKKANR